MKTTKKSTSADKLTANTLPVGLRDSLYAALKGFVVRSNMTIDECLKQAFQAWFDDVAPDAPTPKFFTKLSRDLTGEYGRGTWQKGHIAGFLDPEMSARVSLYCEETETPIDLLAGEAVASWLHLIAEPLLAA